MRDAITKFLQSERGAVTVDWVVLTAAVLGISAGVIGSITGGALDQSSGLGVYLNEFEFPDH